MEFEVVVRGVRQKFLPFFHRMSALPDRNSRDNVVKEPLTTLYHICDIFSHMLCFLSVHAMTSVSLLFLGKIELSLLMFLYSTPASESLLSCESCPKLDVKSILAFPRAKQTLEIPMSPARAVYMDIGSCRIGMDELTTILVCLRR